VANLETEAMPDQQHMWGQWQRCQCYHVLDRLGQVWGSL